MTETVLGVELSALDLDATVSELERWIIDCQRGIACFANAHVMVGTHRDEHLATAVRDADIVAPDGAPVAWLLGRRLRRRVERITGSDVFEELCRRSPTAGYRHYFLGSTPETLEALVERVRARYPGLEVAGTHAPPFGPVTRAAVRDAAAHVVAAAPDIVWVGLGAPKQEIWMHEARKLIDAPVLAGVGAVFDFASGQRRRAPEALQRLGLEWAFRLAQEPRRLAHRYLTTNSAFVALALREAVAIGRRSGS
jgi:N-acetylglucosaminyldiphosphoundecaprenol N-acetyl-beta-D-mannosaminyltransferase